LFIGSSSFTKWKDVSDWFPDKRIINRGFGGSSLPHLIQYFDRIVTPYDPVQVVVYCGENDVAASTAVTADTVLLRWKQLHTMIRKTLPQARISFVSLKPSPVRAAFLPTVLESNRKIREYCNNNRNTEFIDVFTPMLTEKGEFREELFVGDRLHMNEKGYLIWQKAMAPYLMPTKQLTLVKKSATRPNIIWLSVEDMSPRLGCYGDSTIPTPNIDRLAREGMRYTRVFTAAGVCAPSRNAIITGRMQTSNGGHNMRTLMNTYPAQTGLPQSYSAVMPIGVRHLGEYLRAEGYYCTNNDKTDYQFEEQLTFWDATGSNAHYRNREKDQPFFAVFNSNITHESQVWARSKKPLRVDPKKVKVPPYYPDTDSVRLDIARFYTNISEMDDWVGERMKELEAEGLLENTIVMFWSDHGDGLPYVKREVTDRGIRIPLVVRFPQKEGRKGIVEDRLISSIDFAPTVLSLAGIRPPSNMQGKAFLGTYTDNKPHEYVFAARDRLDSEYDRVRSAHDGQVQYIVNFQPELPRYVDVAYRKQQASMREILRLRDAGKLSPTVMRWFETKGTTEELYDVIADPHQLHDLAHDPKYAEILDHFRSAFRKWQTAVPDMGAVAEKDLVRQMWNNGTTPPATAAPFVMQSGGWAGLVSATAGAGIAYRVIKADGKIPSRWEVYAKPFPLQRGEKVEAVAQRIGYARSETVLSDAN
jgi:arylsulfatase A-like enzyme/lysophospholipase L1-like esterase